MAGASRCTFHRFELLIVRCPIRWEVQDLVLLLPPRAPEQTIKLLITKTLHEGTRARGTFVDSEETDRENAIAFFHIWQSLSFNGTWTAVKFIS